MPSIADSILEKDISSLQYLLSRGEDVNQLDEYGFTPLIEAAIINNIEISKILLEFGANPNQQDATGGTALHWAAENNNLPLCALLLKYKANPNAYTLAGQPVLAMPMLRQQKPLQKLLLNSGANQVFAQDFINAKLLGHVFELVGTANIIDPRNQFVEVDFEGFFLEVTLGLISNSLRQFQNHFAARELRRYMGLSQLIVDTIERAAALIKFQQYNTDLSQHQTTINTLAQQEPLLIPVGYEGHAITFIKQGDFLVKCDRREESRLYDNIMFYHIKNLTRFNPQFIQKLIYQKQSTEFINQELPHILGLEPFTDLKIEAQISGNCSWANVEACIPALFFLAILEIKPEAEVQAYYKSLALKFFQNWRAWNKKRALQFCLESFKEAGPIRKAAKAEILAAILFQRGSTLEKEKVEAILSALLSSPYEYILQNYLKIYHFERPSEEGKLFAQLLKDYSYLK